ncbi:MAG: hypothetical protein HYY06_01020 [Deltaproteobacteria bacterium]|nr:hypothetical protein [Deltaproteobacteria bacterium]
MTAARRGVGAFLLVLLVAANVVLWARPSGPPNPPLDHDRLASWRLTYPEVRIRGVDRAGSQLLVDGDVGRRGVEVPAGARIVLDFGRPRLVLRVLAEGCRSGATTPAIDAEAYVAKRGRRGRGGAGSLPGLTPRGLPGSGPLWELDRDRVQRLVLRPSRAGCLGEVTPIYGDLALGIVRGPADRPGPGPYLAELLWAHGIPAVQLLPPPAIVADVLDRHEAILVPNVELDDESVAALVAFCRRGGLLVAFGETSRLARAVGPGRFLVERPETLAERYSKVGRGTALVFPEDVPAIVRSLRQGDPARAGVESDGVPGSSPGDLFADQTPSQRSVPTAYLYVRTVVDRLQAWMRQPLLRVAPLPGDARTVLVLTADQDFADRRLLSEMAGEVEDRGGELTFLLTSGTRQGADDPPDAATATDPDEELAEDLAQGGAEISIHPNTWGLSETIEAQDLVLAKHIASFRARYRRRPRIVRFHKVIWRGFVDTALALERNGISMDLDFVTLATKKAPGLGYMSAGATPLRFTDVAGHLIGVLQQPTQIDDHVLYWVSGRYQQMRPEAFRRQTLKLLDAAADRGGEPVVANHHPLWFGMHPEWLRAVLDWAERRDVPVWSAERWLDHTLARRAVRIWRDGGDWIVRGDGAPMRLYVPLSVAGRPLGGAYCDGEWMPRGEEVYVPDIRYAPLNLPARGCRLRLAYE